MGAKPGYEKLWEIFKQVADEAQDTNVSLALSLAYEQSAGGKGAERHANEKAWLDQPILDIQRLTSWGFSIGQSMKKTQEASRMAAAQAKHELLGAAVYLAGAHAFSEEIQKDPQQHDPAMAERMSEKEHYQLLLHEMAKIAIQETFEEERRQIRRCLTILGRLIAHEEERAKL